LSKPAAPRAWLRAFCITPVLAIIAVALLGLSPARHRSTAGTALAASVPSQPRIVTPAARGRIQASYAALPLAFEPNQGQTDAQVKYLARGNGYILFLTENDAVFSLHSGSAESQASTVRRGSALSVRNPRQHNSQKDATAVVRMHLAGANSLAKVEAGGQLAGTTNYFLGNDPSKWHSGVGRYARVSYQDIYPGVNMAFHGAQRQPEFDFIVAPGANAAPIGFDLTGAQGMKLDDAGDLVISSAAGDVLLHQPVAYQEHDGARQAVSARFLLNANNQISFELGNYDHSRELVIDPSVSYEYSTYLGGTGDDEGEAIAFDTNGNAYVTGETASTNFPGFSSTNKLVGSTDVFVTKIAADGSSLVYSTYVGGTLNQSGNGIAVDSSGDAYVAGFTASTNFPITTGAFQTKLGSGAVGNVCVFELGSSGALVYSTYLGGTGEDTGLGIALDSTNSAYVVGKTSSTDFPTQSPIQASLNGTSNGFVTKLNASGTAPLVYSTYLGGGTGDFVGAVALDSSANAYVTGATASSSFPTTTGAFQTKCGTDGTCNGGLFDAFVTVIKADGSGYVYSTFLGGSSDDAGDGIAVDSSGSAYVTGLTASSDFPVASALQGTYGGNSDAFVTKLNPAGSALVYSTYLGGAQYDLGASIALDGGNNAYVTGQTASSAFPTAGPTQSALKGGNDAFVAEINSTGSALAFSTYLGGALDEDDGGNFGAIAVDSAGAHIYVTGNTASVDFPTHAPFQLNSGGLTDAFVVKYTQVTFDLTATTPSAVAAGGSTTSTATLTEVNGYSSAVTLTCSVSGGGSPAPACSVTGTNPVTPVASPGATSTVSITTTGPSAATFVPRSRVFYAMWLPIAGLSLVGMSFSSTRSRRKKLLGFLMIAMVMAALFVMPACGGGSSGGGGGGGTGTPAGSYTVTITGTGTDGTVQTAPVILTVN